jgi:hypothetical protein
VPGIEHAAGRVAMPADDGDDEAGGDDARAGHYPFRGRAAQRLRQLIGARARIAHRSKARQRGDPRIRGSGERAIFVLTAWQGAAIMQASDSMGYYFTSLAYALR